MSRRQARGRIPPSRSIHRTNYDSLNSETFGDSSSGTDGDGDWMAGHEAFVRSTKPSRPPLPTENKVDGLTQQLKELWPSSPETPPASSSSPLQPNIWTSPEPPYRVTQQDIIGSPSLPVGGKVLTVEELENQLSSSSSPQQPTQTPPPPTNQVLRPPPGLRVPQLPPHPLMGQNRGFVPPPPHFMIRGPRGIPQGFPPYMMPPPFQRGPPPRIVPPLLPPSYPRGPFSPPQQRWPGQQQNEMMFRKSRRSEYLGEMKSDGSGFMTQKEKEWVIRIQLIQLQSSDPSNDDYYYMNYIKRKQEHRKTQQNDQSSNHCILSLPNINHEERAYTPREFAGSLGKLAVCNLATPRRKIDVGVAGDSGKETSRKRQALVAIEKIFILILKLEEENPNISDTERDQWRADILSILNIKQNSSKNELLLFHQLLTVCKGKKLVNRLFPLLSTEQGEWVLQALLSNLSSVLKKDSTDQVLPVMIPHISSLIAKLPLSSLNRSTASLLEGGLTKIAQSVSGAAIANELLMRGASLAPPLDPASQARSDVDTWYQLIGELVKGFSPYKDRLDQSTPILLSIVTSLNY